MGFGVLESRSGLKHVPGTTLLDTHNTSGATGKNSHVLLIPQPSNSPNDPLNWPLWQRDLLLVLYCYCNLLCIGGIGPILSPMAVILLEEFKISFTQVSLLTGYSLCATGAVGIFISALARKYGKRPCLLFSISCAFAGLSVAMFESVMFSVIGDLYYVHERGSRMAIYVTSNSGVANLPAMLAGKITTDLGWRWVFWLLAVFLGVAWLGVVFFGWETAYNRNEVYNIDTSSQNTALERSRTASTTATTSRTNILQRMAPFQGSFTEESILKMVLRPFFILLNQTVAWAVLLIAFPTLWLVGISFVIAQVFAAPPYLLSTSDLGYMSAGPVIGGTIGCLLCGWISDPIVKNISRRNNGTYEPEFRLILMILATVTSVLGYFLFGNLIVQGKSVIGIAAIWAIVVSSTQFSTVAIGGYMVDAFRDISIEVFIISMICKNFLFFGFTYFLNDWIASWGPAKMFNTIGGIQLALCLTTIPIWVFGKRLRAWWHTHDVLSKI
ncbi:major facilitator superfamily domain-containing protein [Exophiala viscosa]|uniref:Major facilitator superfamily domain-containing protein n=1 Tax=Exophiala viscosa TaxID=2486360 RepID=A0AAN6IID1_9EURO|nr:major facilitator superfamily domain-containing protein [Exophiala viscosa]